LDTVTEEDICKKDFMIQDCKGIAENSWKFGNKYWQNNSHSSQVTRLALQFFDGLISVHKLGDRERCWLECAAILHDVGLSQGTARHHRESAKIILNDTQLPFTSRERQIVASIARYHRKGLPKQKHFNLAALDPEIIRKIKVLASLLRVADGLDYTHQSKVKILGIKVGARRIIAECLSESESVLEEQAFNKKKDLFEKIFAKKLVLVWKR
jgi:exopolyphosphatase/guanosine-5'-triphosphate,3'-diphosphate pyrophosphatase